MTTPAPNPPGPDHRAEVTPNKWVPSPELRKYLYLALALIVAGLIVFGLLTEDQVAEWARLTVHLITVGAALLAAVNTPPKR